MSRRWAEAAALIPEGVVLSGKIPVETPDEELVRAREALRKALSDVLPSRPAREPVGPFPFNPFPDVSTPDGFGSLFAGAESARSLAFASGGR